MIKLGITGGIGSGKTYVARLLEERGIPVYYTDVEAKRLMESDAEIRKALTALVGADAYRSDGGLNRPVLAAYLFSGSSHAALVNSVVHPVVRQHFLHWAQRQPAGLVAMECAILFESGFDALVDEVLAVCAPEPLRLHRAMLRDGATEKQVRDRMAAQWTDEERSARADHVIMNDGLTDVREAVSSFLSSLSCRR